MVYSINNPTNISGAKLPKKIHAKPADKAGRFGKLAVRKLTTLSQTIEDLQEELSAAQSEHFESKKIEENKVEDYQDHIYENLVSQVEKEYPSQEEPQKQHIKDFLSHLERQQKNKSNDMQQSIDGFLNKFSADKAEIIALVVASLNSGADVLTAPVKKLLKEKARELVASNSAEIQAGVNSIGLARKANKKLGVGVRALQENYQNLVCNYEGILPVLTQLAANKQLNKFEAMTDFLMQTAAKDLSSTRSSVQPARLQKILAEFQGVKIFNSFVDWSNKIYEKFEPQLKGKTDLGRTDLFRNILNFIAHPENFNSQINTPLNKLEPSKRVLVLQGLRSNIRSLPNYLFANGKPEKARILFPLQNEIDKLVFEQDA